MGPSGVRAIRVSPHRRIVTGREITDRAAARSAGTVTR